MSGVLANQAMNYLVSGTPPRRLGNAHPNIVPYQVFAVSDGHLIIAVGNILGLPGIAADDRFATNQARVENRETLISILEPVIAGWTRDKLLAELAEKHVPAGPINTLADLFADPQIVARRMRIDLDDGEGTVIPGMRLPILFDGEPAVASKPSPRLSRK
jgi:crotonobetainyl-CoA:carnitine CoA-transferase CaiB-like acyl-CoA transferase